MKVYHLTIQKNSMDNELIFNVATSIKLGKLDHVSDVLANKYPELSYKLVAEVNTDDMDFAFEMTNSIENYWGDNEDVEDFTTGCRSTSVGDLMQNSLGQMYFVSNFGFKLI